jgi:hypothetical protein
MFNERVYPTPHKDLKAAFQTGTLTFSFVPIVLKNYAEEF